MQYWNRNMYFEDTQLPWLLPSPNLRRKESSLTFPAMVLFEGTTLSEDRGTTQALKIMGHPKIEPFSLFKNHFNSQVKLSKSEGFSLRPFTFLPTFHKQMDKVCGGFQLHVTDKSKYKPWRVSQFLLREIYHYLGDDFEWFKPPYEYNFTQEPIDIINGTDKPRHWVIQNNPIKLLDTFEDLKNYKLQLQDIKMY